MTLQKHPLSEDFPELRERIHQLKCEDAHFARLYAEYGDVDLQLLRIEQEIETPTDAVVEDLKKKRVQLKDKLYQMLTAA